MKTIICDIDGTIFQYPADGNFGLNNENPVLLPGVLKKFNQWEMKGCRIILITGRRESWRSVTEAALRRAAIPFDILIIAVVSMVSLSLVTLLQLECSE